MVKAMKAMKDVKSVRKSMTKTKTSLSKQVGTGPEAWPAEYEEIVKRLDTPAKIQDYLDNMPYDPAYAVRSLWQTFELGKAHCFAGSLIAAYCLNRHGYGAPQIVGLEADPYIDDGHSIAVFKKDGLWGSISKSNYNGLRGRDPVYTTVRELVMSYFEFFVNPDGLKSLRAYSDPVDLNKLDPKREWVLRRNLESGATKADRASSKCPNLCLPKGFRAKRGLSVMKGKTMTAQTLGCNAAGLFGNC